MFSVAASIILGETWRSSRSQSKRRDDVDDKLDELGTQVVELTSRVNEITGQWQVQMQEEKHRFVFLSFMWDLRSRMLTHEQPTETTNSHGSSNASSRLVYGVVGPSFRTRRCSFLGYLWGREGWGLKAGNHPRHLQITRPAMNIPRRVHRRQRNSTLIRI